MQASEHRTTTTIATSEGYSGVFGTAKWRLDLTHANWPDKNERVNYRSMLSGI